MMDAYRQIGQYIRHWHRSANSKGHGVHSPFLFDFITRVLPDTGHGPQFSLPETYRQDLLSDRTGFSRVELGGGSRHASKTITVQSVAKRSLQTARWSRLLYRILQQYQPGSVLELGTSFGVTTQYLALAAPSQTVYTLEGDPFIARQAQERFRRDGLQNVRLVEGNMDQTLAPTLANMQSVGMAWLDGNHRLEPTLRYFDQVLECVHNDSWVVLDDIYWSPEMQAAWHQIQANPRVRCTIDLFRLGIVLFRTEFHEPTHIRLRH